MEAMKPLTAEAIALNEKKMSMSLDDIIKMSKAAAPKGKKQHKRRAWNKSDQGFSKSHYSAQDKPTKLRRFMDTRSTLRQGVLAQRRTNFPVANEAAKKTGGALQRSRVVNQNRVPNWKPRNCARIQRRAAGNVGFGTKMKEQRIMRAQQPRWNDAVQERNRGQGRRRLWGRDRQVTNLLEDNCLKP